MIGADEDEIAFARRVQQLTASALGLVATNYSCALSPLPANTHLLLRFKEALAMRASLRSGTKLKVQ